MHYSNDPELKEQSRKMCKSLEQKDIDTLRNRLYGMLSESESTRKEDAMVALSHARGRVEYALVKREKEHIDRLLSVIEDDDRSLQFKINFVVSDTNKQQQDIEFLCSKSMSCIEDISGLSENIYVKNRIINAVKHAFDWEVLPVVTL